MLKDFILALKEHHFHKCYPQQEVSGSYRIDCDAYKMRFDEELRQEDRYDGLELFIKLAIPSNNDQTLIISFHTVRITRMNTEQTCPLCAKGVLQTRSYGREMVHKGVNLSVEGLVYDYCPICEAELTSPEQMDHNTKLIRVAFVAERARLKREQNLLSGQEIRAIRENLGITQKQAAKIFGGGPTAFAKYEAEDVVQSVGMDRLLRVAAAVPTAAKWLCNYAGEEIDLSTQTQRLEGLPIAPLSKEKTPLRQLFSAEDSIKVGRFDLKNAISSTANDKDYANAA